MKKSNHQIFRDIAVSILHSRDVAHIVHLKSRSLAEHLALQEYYEEIIPLVDDLIECYQGEQNMLLDLNVASSSYHEPIDYFENLLEVTTVADFSGPIQNVLDDINTIITKLLYKLRFLK